MLSGAQRSEIIQKITPYSKYGCLLRLVDQSDAEFIHNLRKDPFLSRFLSSVSGDINDQKNWISGYKIREESGEEFYFICIDPETGSRLGLNRIYNFRDNIFELGSWIYTPQADISKSILGDIITREFAYDILQFDICTFKVRKENRSVIRYHKEYLPDLKGEDNQNMYFKLSKASFNQHKEKYLKICGYGQSR